MLEAQFPRMNLLGSSAPSGVTRLSAGQLALQERLDRGFGSDRLSKDVTSTQLIFIDFVKRVHMHSATIIGGAEASLALKANLLRGFTWMRLLNNFNNLKRT